eukprot:CAMPEP_0182855026 /NCGR_PEP_ID=MMETSP0034_2-20130328/1600_1 /TAXON_ID=156128 /ORGANISM="Nephroselmis pyriformis, Strain CCMP717" /LENGTH=348 /DNA_ID=CAMNT_0024985927 /DNA_START=92 /DNA_END=1135 /DNA_ORIENTATION=+
MRVHNTGTAVIAGIAASMACIIAMVQIVNHLRHYTEPTFQRYIVRIIFMVPVYSMVSFFSFLYVDNAIWFDTIRDCYESWVIYNFLSLCFAYVGGPGAVVVHMNGQSIRPSWMWGTCCFPPIPVDGVLMRRCKQGALQFVIIKPILAVITLVLEGYGKFPEGNFNPLLSYFWITFVYNICYGTALLSLVLFYLAARDLLQPFRPVLKFALVKAVIFLTFWQGLASMVSVRFGVLDSTREAKALQNFLICGEMLITSVVLLWAFPYLEYKHDHGAARAAGELGGNMVHAISMHDVVSDTVHQFAPMYNDYILYSDGTTSGPKRIRTRTFVAMGREMLMGRTPQRGSGGG